MEISTSLFSFKLHVYVDRYVGKKEEERKGKRKEGEVRREEGRKEGRGDICDILSIYMT